MKKMVIVAVLLVASCRGAFAATIYLDGRIAQPSCTNYDPASRSCGGGSGTAYRTPYEASQALRNGDRLYLRAGRYYQDVRSKPGYMWTVGALAITASNTWTENYQGEEVWIQSGPDNTGIGADDTNNALGLSGSGNTINGISYNLKFWGGSVLSGTGNTVQGCDFSGGWDHEAPFGTTNAAFPNVIRIFFAVNATVRNCKLHDNKWCADGTPHNQALVMHTEDQNTIVENCHFYNPLASLMYIKHQSTTGTVQMTYRYNLLEGGTGFDYPDSFKSKYIYIYQNIFRNTQVGNSRHSVYDGYVLVYNNLYYNVGKVLYDWKAGTLGNWISFFNNIIVANGGSFANSYYDAASDFAIYSDHNLYHRVGGGGYTWRHGSNPVQNALAGWKSLSRLDANSSDADPGFLNASGTFSQPSDFKRASYPQAGRGGAYPAVVGPYVTGNEIIGLTGKQISAPRNLRIQ